MSQTRVYFPQLAKNITISDKETIHKLIHVLRLCENSEVMVFDGKGKQGAYIIKKVKNKELSLFLKGETKECKKKGWEVALAFPLLKKIKIDFILQKATELGTDYFYPFYSRYSLNFTPQESKLLHWQKVIIESSRQSGRLFIPKIMPVCSFSQLIKIKGYPLKFIACQKGREKLTKEGFVSFKKKVIVISGPEGGFSPQELNKAQDEGFKLFRVCANILRSETAAIFCAGLIRYFTDEV